MTPSAILNHDKTYYKYIIHTFYNPKCPHNPNTDINNNQKIDIKDVATISKQFGKTDP